MKLLQRSRSGCKQGLSTLVMASLLSACGGADSPRSTFEYAVQGLYSASLSPSGQYAVVGSIHHGGSLWDSSNHARLYNWNHREGENTSLVASGFSPDQRFAVTAGQQTLVLWSLADGAPHWFWTAPAGILDVSLVNNGNFALLGLDNHTAVYFDIKNGGVQQTLYHQGRVETVAISDAGRYALTGTANNFARLWDMNTGEQLQQWSHDNDVNTVALSGDGRYAFTAGQLEQAHIWDAFSGERLHTLSGDEAYIQKRFSYTAAVFSEDGNQLLTGTSSGRVQLWDVRAGTELRRWELKRRDPIRPTSVVVLTVAFADQGYKAIASNGFINMLQ